MPKRSLEERRAADAARKRRERARRRHSQTRSAVRRRRLRFAGAVLGAGVVVAIGFATVPTIVPDAAGPAGIGPTAAVEGAAAQSEMVQIGEEIARLARQLDVWEASLPASEDRLADILARALLGELPDRAAGYQPAAWRGIPGTVPPDRQARLPLVDEVARRVAAPIDAAMADVRALAEVAEASMNRTHRDRAGLDSSVLDRLERLERELVQSVETSQLRTAEEVGRQMALLAEDLRPPRDLGVGASRNRPTDPTVGADAPPVDPERDGPRIPSASGPLTVPVPLWDARPREDLRVVLERWASAAGWSVVWDVDHSYPVQVPVSLQAPFEEAVSLLVNGFARADPPFVAEIWGNRVLRIVPVGGAR